METSFEEILLIGGPYHGERYKIKVDTSILTLPPLRRMRIKPINPLSTEKIEYFIYEKRKYRSLSQGIRKFFVLKGLSNYDASIILYKMDLLNDSGDLK